MTLPVQSLIVLKELLMFVELPNTMIETNNIIGSLMHLESENHIFMIFLE